MRRLLFVFIALITAATGISAQQQADREKCGTKHPDEETAIQIDQSLEQFKKSHPIRNHEQVTVDVLSFAKMPSRLIPLTFPPTARDTSSHDPDPLAAPLPSPYRRKTPV